MQTDSEQERYAALIDRFSSQRILVIGDLMLDEFIWGKVSRISPEAPVPVVNVTGESYFPGGAANVARNLREFTTHTSLMGLVGADSQGRQLCGLLQASGIDTNGVEQDADCATIVKTRIIARNQQVVRVDRERPAALTPRQLARAKEYLATAIARVDGVVVADYGKGFLNQELAGHICQSARAHGKVLTVDPHPHTSLAWSGATAVKPNRVEAFGAAGLPLTEPVDPPMNDLALLQAARKLMHAWDTANLLVTLGEHGMLLFQGDAPPYHTPTRAQEVFDVSGAGDTAIAVFTLGLLAGATPSQAAELANRASGIVVGKLGTATVSPAELAAGFR
jgi:D-beta-D-heptose 7-phosphate kinase/D-beta-D-heptose 1-phosphate adenosyltransferase